MEKEYVFIPKKLAEKIKDLESDKQMEDTIIGYYNQSRRELQGELDCLDEDVIQYKANMMKARQAFREAKEEQLDANYELWEKFDADIKGVSAYVAKATSQLQPLKAELSQLKELMNQIDKWEIEKLVGLIDKLNSSFYGETGNILKFLFENYKSQR